MIAAWMLYCVGIGLALTVAAYAAERALYLAGRPTRWAWSVALLGTLLLPVAATVRPQAFRAIPVPVAEPTRAPPTAAVAAVPQGTVPSTAVSRRALSLSDFDGVLLWGWGLASVTALLVLAAAAARLVALRRRWRTALVDGRSVLLADDVGPAVAGLWPPRVVIPVWALNLTDTQRRLMLAHEDEHVRARDPWLLAAGTAALVLAPWNLALWWLSQRLRLAVEMDCDARVLSRGYSTPDYGELLLHVGQRRARFPLTAAALGETRSFLERRIRRMAARLPKWRWAQVATALAIATAAAVGACEAPRPTSPESANDRDPVATHVGVTWLERQGRRTVLPPDSVMVRWMRAAIAKEYPEYLSHRATPPVYLWFHGTTGGRVIRSSRTMSEGVRVIGYREVRAQLPEAGPMRPGMWFGQAYPLGPGRDDVRAIWLYDGAAEQGAPEVSLPLDSARAVAIALQNLCGAPSILRDTTCLVRSYEHTGGRHLVVLDRRPPAGNDRVAVRLSGAVGNVDLEANEVRPTRLGLDTLLTESMVDDPPVFLSGPQLQYPKLLRQAGIQGRVLVRAIIDTTGRAEPASVQVVESTHPGFDQAARDFVLHARFSRGRLHGRAVRVPITLPVNFRMGR